MTDAQTTWVVGGASSIGSAHVRRGIANQDAIAWLPDGGSHERFIATVSDGHGGQPHFRSNVGSKLAVEAAISALEWFLDDPEQFQQLPKDVVDIWRKSVQQHIEEHPFTNDAPSNVFSAYGATLIAAAASPRFLVVLQIGDGDLLLGYPSGKIERPLADDEGLVGEQTYSLCLEDAHTYVRVRMMDLDWEEQWPNFVLLSTDGVSKSFVNDAAYFAIVENYRDLCLKSVDNFQTTLDALPAWLEEVSGGGSGDDSTLCIAIRRTDDSPTHNEEN